MLDLAATLDEFGHEVTVFWSPVRAEEAFRNRLHSLNSVGSVQVELQRSVGLHDLSGLLRLKSALIQNGPFDVLHAHSSKAGALVRMLPRSVTGLRVYTPHALRTMDPDISGSSARVYGGIERLLATRKDPIIAVSSAEKAHAMGLGIPGEQIHVVANGADPKQGLSRADARAAFEVRDDDVVVGFVGRMVAQKDPVRFVEAVESAARQVPNLKAVMMGDGPLMDEVRKKAGSAPIHFMGWCDAPALIHGLDLLCVTSRYEALAYSFLEALHAGVPIVSTAVGGVEETIVDDQTGSVVPVDADADELAAKIADLVANHAKRQSCSAASLELAAQRTLHSMTKATLAVYEGKPATQPMLSEKPEMSA